MSRFAEFYNRLSFRNTVEVATPPASAPSVTTATTAGTAATAGTAVTAQSSGIAERINIINEPDNFFTGRSSQ